jgi:predicted enzyme related to lactoylglutathione lyase
MHLLTLIAALLSIACRRHAFVTEPAEHGLLDGAQTGDRRTPQTSSMAWMFFGLPLRTMPRGKMLAVDSRPRYRTFRRSHQPIHNKEEPTMPMTIQHVHIKSKDPKQAAQFYMDNLGATLKSEITGRGCQLDLHGLQLNVTGIVATQSRQQNLGIEHIAVDTDDYTGTLAKLKANGVRILEEMPPNANGRRVCFLEAPDGAQVEIIEKM